MSLLSYSQNPSHPLDENRMYVFDGSAGSKSYLNYWDSLILKMNLPEPLIDFGCGSGRLVHKLSDIGYQEIYGVDLSAAAMKTEKITDSNDNEKLIFAESMLEFLPFKSGIFKSATMLAVLHHLEVPLVVLREVARVLQNNGVLILAEPYFSPVKRHLVNFALRIFPIAGDKQFFSPAKIIKLAETAGFEKKNLINLPLSYILEFQKCFV